MFADAASTWAFSRRAAVFPPAASRRLSNPVILMRSDRTSWRGPVTSNPACWRKAATSAWPTRLASSWLRLTSMRARPRSTMSTSQRTPRWLYVRVNSRACWAACLRTCASHSLSHEQAAHSWGLRGMKLKSAAGLMPASTHAALRTTHWQNCSSNAIPHLILQVRCI